jgi:hypothetical protein
MAGEKRTHSTVLCIKDYHNKSGQLLLKAGETYPDLEWKDNSRTYDIGVGLVWNCPVVVDTPYGKVRFEKEEADEFLCSHPSLADAMYLQCYQGNLIMVPPAHVDAWAGLISTNGKLGFEAARDDDLLITGNSQNPDYIKRLCSFVSAMEGEVDRHGSAEECLDAARFLADLEQLECDRTEGRSPFAEVLSEYTRRMYQVAAVKKMKQEGIDPQETLHAFYKGYAENGTLPELYTKLPGTDISLDDGVEER